MLPKNSAHTVDANLQKHNRLPLQFLGNRAVPQLALAGRQLVDPRGEQLMAFRIAERAHGAFQTPAVSEVMVHRGPLLLVRVPPVAFPAHGGDAGAFLLEPVRVPRQQRALAGIAEFVYHVRGAVLVFDVQVHGPVALLPAVPCHKGVLLPVGKSKKTSPPRITLMDLLKIIRKHLVTAIIAFVVVVAGVSAYTFLAPAKYTATAQTMATYNASDGGESIAQQSTGGSYISNRITSYPTLATTSKVLKPVIDDLGLDETVTDLAGQVTVTNPTNTAFVNIAVVDGDPKQAADIANSVAESLKNVIESDLYSGDKSPVKLSIVQKAQVPTSKSSPKTALYLAVGVVLGIIIGVFAALIKDLLNTKVEETSDVRGIVRASSLGSVPMDASLDDKRPVLVSQPNGAIAEEFRRIHTNIDFLQTDRTEGVGQLLVITSAQPSEGKTTMSINTAVALAEDGAKVLLIDADLRHPSVAHHLGIEGAAGLAHVLSGQMGPKDVVQSYWKPNLHILPGGKRPANAGVLLSSETMKLMVEQALTQYDYVIIDTAPLTVSNDGAVFGRWAKGLLLVVSRNVCEKKSLQEAVDTLATAQVPVLGFIFNRADPKKVNSHSNYYYYYEDGAPRSSHRANGKKKRI